MVTLPNYKQLHREVYFNFKDKQCNSTALRLPHAVVGLPLGCLQITIHMRIIYNCIVCHIYRSAFTQNEIKANVYKYSRTCKRAAGKLPLRHNFHIIIKSIWKQYKAPGVTKLSLSLFAN